MKPLFRWTVGGVPQHGIDMLAMSIRMMRTLHDFEAWVCYNNLKDDQLEQIEELGVTLFEQPASALPLPPVDVAWKLYPPRLDISRHEVFIDNDLIVFKRMPKIEKFLSRTDCVIYTKSLFNAFGTYKAIIPGDFRLNSGLFGLPPGYDFTAEVIKELDGKTAWDDRWDEQGLVALLLGRFPERIEIELDEVQICHEGAFGNPKYGYHFVGANAGEVRAWRQFQKKVLV